MLTPSKLYPKIPQKIKQYFHLFLFLFNVINITLEAKRAIYLEGPDTLINSTYSPLQCTRLESNL